MDRITYDYYRIFYYVAKYKSLSMAAEILHSNQPNITKFMNKLEEQLGCKLMIRSNRGVSLTAEGEALFSHVSVAYSSLREAEEELLSISSMNTGTIRISATETALHGILLDALARFREQYPGIRLLITNDSTPEAIRSLKNGVTDLAVVTSPTVLPDGFRKTSLLTFHELLVASSVSSFAGHQSLSCSEIATFPIVGLGHHTKNYEYYSKLFLSYGIEWHPDIDVATADQLLPIIKAGLGIGFVPEFIAEPELLRGSLVKIETPEIHPTREIVLLEAKSSISSNAVKEFKKMLLQR